MKSVAFIVPGFTDSPNQPEYKKIATLFLSQGIESVPVKIKWNHTVLTENANQLISEYNKTPADKKYVLGFSFGAVTSFIAAPNLKFDALILCSLSPFFQEDFPILKEWEVTRIGKKRKENFLKMNNKSIAKKIKCKTYLFYGTEEDEVVKIRAENTYKNLKCTKRLISVNEVKHNIADPRYLAEIEKVINTL